MLPKLAEKDKPLVEGPIDANIFAIMGISARALRRAKLKDYASEMTARVMNECRTYDQALVMVQEYVDLNP